MRPVLDLPNTRSGDAIRALMAAVIFVLLSAAADAFIGGWWSGGWPSWLIVGTFFGLWQFAFFRWLHRPKASAQRTPPAA
jgi:fatty acid desaturase